MNKSIIKKLLLTLTVYILIFGATIFLVLMPIYNRYQADKTIKTKTQVTLESNQSKIQSLQKFAKSSQDFETIYQNVSNLWPDSVNVSEFIVQMEGLAKDTGLIIDSFAIEELKTSTPKAKNSEQEDEVSPKTIQKTNQGTKFTMSFKAQYNDLMNLITRMETLARLNSINSITINSGTDGLVVSVSGYIYYGK